MAVKIRLKRMGQIRAPFYRIVVADSRSKRDGRAIEEVGLYNPMTDPSTIEVKSERVQYWLGVGAQPTEQVAALLKVTGDWQKFKGLPGAEGTYRVPAANTKPPRIPAGGVAKTPEAPAAEAETPAQES
ncbi:30S ribosomal protein S16 [Kineococcus sp. SYSU DK003]|uniref:30S ribosomal protein S16 n=1 Tax=Kineococcus sp. SYSU DK003 TaxID=3383124 RepID=UPI003D7D059C